MLFEHYNINDDTVTSIFKDNWLMQTFVPTVTHSITSVRVKLGKLGSPNGNIYVVIDSMIDGKPSGSGLTVGYIQSDSVEEGIEGLWYEIPFTSVDLTAGVKYAIVLFDSGSVGDNNNCIYWRLENVGQYPQNSGYSPNAGNIWVDAGWSFMFEEYGIQIVDQYNSPFPSFQRV